MSKISEQKALEAYPEHRVTRYGPLYAYDGTNTPSEYDENIVTRKAFIEGYDQAMQDFLEWLKSYRQETSDKTGYIAGIVNDETIEQFKNYMQDEM